MGEITDLLKERILRERTPYQITQAVEELNMRALESLAQAADASSVQLAEQIEPYVEEFFQDKLYRLLHREGELKELAKVCEKKAESVGLGQVPHEFKQDYEDATSMRMKYALAVLLVAGPQEARQTIDQTYQGLVSILLQGSN